MTFKANEIEQYPYLVYTDDAGNVYDPNGGGGGGEVTVDSCVTLTLYVGDIGDDTHFMANVACSPTVEDSMYFFEDNQIMQFTYGVPAGWICGLLQGGYSETDPDTPITFDGTETLTAYKLNFDTMEREEIAVEFTYGEYLNAPAWRFTVPAMTIAYGLDISIDFGS